MHAREPSPTRRRDIRGWRGVSTWALGIGVFVVAPEATATEGASKRSDVTFHDGSEIEDASPGEEGETTTAVETSEPASPPSAEVTVSSSSPPSGRAARRRRARRDGPLGRYLERPVRLGPHHVDHGVLQVSVAGGWPHRYRLGLSLGLFDHLTVGATTHWLPGQKYPQVAPQVAVAFFRNHLFETGVRHFWSLFPPPLADFDPTTRSYPGRAQWTLAHGSFGQAWVTGGLDAGIVRIRVDDPGQDPDPMANNPTAILWRFAGGLHLRAGTRRWGFTAQVLVPRVEDPEVFAELRFDLRFGLFERRPKGGWWPRGVVEDWDRPSPF